MIVVRNCFTAKPGSASKLAALFVFRRVRFALRGVGWSGRVFSSKRNSRTDE